MADVQRTLATADSRPAVERILPWLVAGTAAAVILIEIALTRLFSVLLYYHYSFLAVALALFGLAAGGVSASRRPIDDMTAVLLQLRQLVRRAAMALLGLVFLLVLASPGKESVPVAVGVAMVSAVPLFLLSWALRWRPQAWMSEVH